MREFSLQRYHLQTLEEEQRRTGLGFSCADASGKAWPRVNLAHEQLFMETLMSRAKSVVELGLEKR